MYYYQQSNDLVKQQACASGMPLTSASFGAGNVIPVDDSKLGGVDLENGYYSQAVGSMLSQSLPSSSSSTRQHDGTVIEGFNMAAFDPRSQQFIDEVDNNSAAKQRSLNNVRAFSSLEANTADANRNKWVRVTDASGVSKYGYITRVGVFQVWFAPTTSNPADWLATDPVQKNVGFLGCPAAPTGVSPITIQKNWRQIQPYEIVYNNATPPAPVFYLTDVGVRDVSKSLNNSGNFSCGNEGANVWVRSVQNVLGGTGLHKLLHHLASQVPRVLDLAVELAVRERARATLAKLHIALGVQLVPSPQVPGVLGALTHGGSTLQHDGSEAHLGQHQGGKQATRTQAHHHRTVPDPRGGVAGRDRRGLHRWAPGHVGRGLYVRALGVGLQPARFRLR